MRGRCDALIINRTRTVNEMASNNMVGYSAQRRTKDSQRFSTCMPLYILSVFVLNREVSCVAECLKFISVTVTLQTRMANGSIHTHTHTNLLSR